MTCCTILSSCNTSTLQSGLDRLFADMFPEGEPGAAVLIVKDEDVLYEKCFGLAVTGLEDREITGDTFFNIASCSKQFTAVAILQLASEGKLSLDDNVNNFFPELQDRIWDEIKVKHLLSHSSGIPDGRGYLTREQRIYGDEALATEYLWTLDSLHFSPGTDYEYMNPTYVLLGMLVEKVSGKPFVEYMRDNVFVPAGMDMTLYFDRDHQELIPNMAHGYDNEDGNGWMEYDFGEETFFATRPDGGIYTSVREFAKWEQALRNGTVLDNEWLDRAWTPQTKVSGSTWSDYQNRPDTWYGYGWFLECSDGASPEVIYHTGDNGGFKILAVRYPSSNTLVLVFANRSDWDRYGVKTSIENLLRENGVLN